MNDQPSVRPTTPGTDDLRRNVSGHVAVPGDPRYDHLRTAWDPSLEQHPFLIVVPSDTADVTRAVRFARANGRPVAVQATGHGVAVPADGAVLIVTELLRSVDVDPVTRTAVVGSGARWCDLSTRARRHGLTGLVGTSSEVGVVGYTLGGGLGWFARRYGLASDGVLSFDLVTPDGLAVTVTADRQPEIFWALKGGGPGLLGVVTAMEIELHPIPVVYAGTLTYPIELARAVAERWREWVVEMRPELTSHLVVRADRVMVRGCWVGDAAVGRSLLDEWRRWRRPAHDDWVVRATDDLDALGDGDTENRSAGVTNEWMAVVRDEVVELALLAVTSGADPAGHVEQIAIRHAGGAVSARSAAAVNGRGRDQAFLLELRGGSAEARLAVRTAVAPYVTGAAFLNLLSGDGLSGDGLSGDERRERTTTSFAPRDLERLRTVKRALDPENRFRFGLAVDPVGGATRPGGEADVAAPGPLVAPSSVSSADVQRIASAEAHG